MSMTPLEIRPGLKIQLDPRAEEIHRSDLANEAAVLHLARQHRIIGCTREMPAQAQRGKFAQAM